MKVLAKWSLRLLILVVLVVVLAALYVRYGDLGRHVGTAESVLSKVAGYNIDIGGYFDIDVGETITVTADAVTITNPRWDGQQAIVQTGRLLLVLDTWSLYEPPILIRQLEVNGLNVQLATNAEGIGNWVVATLTSDESNNAPIAVEIDKLSLNDIGFAYDDVGGDLIGEFAGSIKIVLAQTPDISIDLRSSLLELVMPQVEIDDSTRDKAPLFSNDPLDTSAFTALNAAVSIGIDQFIYDEQRFDNLLLHASLDEDGLQISPLSFGAFDGTVSTVTTLVPVNRELVLETSIEATGLHVGSLWSGDATFDSLPNTSGTAQLSGSGSSWKQIMSSSSGELNIAQGPGRLKEIAGAGLFGDVIVQVFQKLNPLSSEKLYTSLECAYYKVSVVDGVATIDDLRLQTDDMMIIGAGKILFTDESVDLSVRAKPREGLGISLGGVANSFVKLGGTLRSPELQLDAAGTATTTGAAVATGGLSLFARGLWDRLSAVNDVCVSSDDDPTG